MTFSRRVAFVVVSCDLEIVTQQIDHRQVGGGLCRARSKRSPAPSSPIDDVALNSKNRRDLPTPASAIAATICPCPASLDRRRA